MLSITYNAKRVAQSVRATLTEEKTSRFTGDGLFIGVGKKAELTHRKRILIARQVILLAKQHNLKSISIEFNDYGLSGEVLATNFEMANYEFDRYKTLPNERTQVETIVINGASKADQESIARGQIIGDEVNACRSLANMPPGLMTPELLAESA